MRTIKHIVIHCTATPQQTTVESLRRYWKDVLKWSRPGYHYVVLPDGSYRSLQDIEHIVNGVAGHNANSISISYIGGVDAKGKPVDNRTVAQKATILDLVKKLKARFPAATVLGHRDFSKDKNGNGIIDQWEFIKFCPCFNAIPEYARL